MAISKVIYKSSAQAAPVTWFDATPATATAADIMAPKTAMLANGVLTTGTGSGGGGGLVYETGTWIPAEDVNNAIISLANQHTTAPAYYEIMDCSGYFNVTSSVLVMNYINREQFYGNGIEVTASQTNYGEANWIYKSGVDAYASGNKQITYPISSTTDTATSYPLYWSKTTEIRAYTNSSSRYFRSGRTYKWIAIWAPST